MSKIFLKDKKIDYVFGTVKRHYTTSTILKYGMNTKRLKFNFDFATAHSTGFFLKKKFLKNMVHLIQNLNCLQITIYITE